MIKNPRNFKILAKHWFKDKKKLFFVVEKYSSNKISPEDVVWPMYETSETVNVSDSRICGLRVHSSFLNLNWWFRLSQERLGRKCGRNDGRDTKLERKKETVRQ